MNKFQKAQLWSSFVPFWSTLFVAVATYIDLTRKRAKMKYWAVYAVIFFISFLVLGAVNRFLLTGENLWINFLTSGLILFGTNYALVKLQLQCKVTSETEAAYTNSAKRRFPKWIIWVIVGSIATLGICVIMFFSDDSHIPDTNGIDTNVVTISEEQITNSSVLSISTMASEGKKGGKTNVSTVERDCDYDIITLRSKKLSGVRRLQATQTECNTASFTVSSLLLEGNAQLFVYVNGEKYQEIPINQEVTFTLTDISSKLILIKIAAESANIEIEISRNVY